MSVSKTTNVGHVKSLKSEELNYTAANVYNLAYLLLIVTMSYHQTETELRVLVRRGRTREVYFKHVGSIE